MDEPSDMPESDVGEAAPPVGNLREELNRRRQARAVFSLPDTVRLIVPFITQLAELHESGATFFVYPAAIFYSDESLSLDTSAATMPPAIPRDVQCTAPEIRASESGGDRRATVFSIGAILYEMLTTAKVGAGMRRPTELVPTLPKAFEVLLGKALVGDPSHRPADLAALAQALHGLAPRHSLPPPPADESTLNGDEDFEVDISLSLMPPAPSSSAAPRIVGMDAMASLDVDLDGDAEPEAPPPPPPSIADLSFSDAGEGMIERLAKLKEALESDPRPRYVVIKDGIDHGPFSAVELLQQIATSTFEGDHPLRDALTNEERPIDEWEQFKHFAHQARLNREHDDRRKALDVVVEKERARLGYKAFIAGGALVLALAAVAGWWYRTRITRDDTLAVTGDEAQSVDIDGGLAGGSKRGGGFRGGGVSPGGHPILPGGMSCEAAQARYVEEYKIGGGSGPPDLTAGHYAAVLNRGSYLNACGVPPSMAVSICAAVQNGRAVGVTVSTKPKNGGISSCVAGQIRSMSFPAHPRLDVARTHFKAN
ncbi:MAG: hypothetical protein JRI23_25240 [Deltaproteobacteria bacterium]|jgi:hypothetical protein|nr:hypothetical protein [Deltaproteobacteria bacterium]MBW2535322.1 hypothetical protein [Deltaproteobacteria bacterium]